MHDLPCLRCGNRDIEKTALKAGVRYCRVCLEFSGPPVPITPRPKIDVFYQLPFSLSQEQSAIAHGIVRAYRRHQSVMVDAVTGSGKTEIVLPLIQTALKEGKQVGFVIPRTDVVKEMVPRFQQAFPTLNIVSVYGGHHENLTGDLIILTTHQIYRYQDYFDVLIFDEVDAFPFVGDPVLAALVKRATRGITIYLSATFAQQDLRRFQKEGGQIFHLFKRYHQHPIPNLTVTRRPLILKWISLVLIVQNLKIKQQPLWIFVPTIAIGRQVTSWLRWFFPRIRFAYSSSESRDEDVQAIKQQADHLLVTTSILERGITLPHLDVIIFISDHPLMTTTVLIQMAGRVGRKKESPTGKVYALCDSPSVAMIQAMEKIKFANDHM